ncbi:MAG: DUF1732 domain-containing protein [Candidatus Omnitrophica bacterium]|nr:DUF1732 domain-containing protein [Candidatus Omnitrophota bacterium]MDD5430096.1 DUF1732 domain-containing protein [Candidatus Omnitrophota bacterium]
MKSMTAYAAASSNRDSYSLQVIIRSNNFKYLDIAVRNLPAEDILLEEAVKKEIKRKILRGKIEAFVFITRPPASKICIDKKAVGSYVSQMRALAKKYNLSSSIQIGDILRLPQAVFCAAKSASPRELVMPVLRKALASLLEFKIKEGKAIKKQMLSNLGKLKRNTEKITKYKPAAGARENGKEDIDEELSLMKFYLGKLGKKINSKEKPKGKSIDFLTQEILRELNAASSKTRKKTSSLLIVEAKNYLERIREQAQNIE